MQSWWHFKIIHSNFTPMYARKVTLDVCVCMYMRLHVCISIMEQLEVSQLSWYPTWFSESVIILKHQLEPIMQLSSFSMCWLKDPTVNSMKANHNDNMLLLVIISSPLFHHLNLNVMIVCTYKQNICMGMHSLFISYRDNW